MRKVTKHVITVQHSQ